jgi:hypothetical protein
MGNQARGLVARATPFADVWAFPEEGASAAMPIYPEIPGYKGNGLAGGFTLVESDGECRSTTAPWLLNRRPHLWALGVKRNSWFQ